MGTVVLLLNIFIIAVPGIDEELRQVVCSCPCPERLRKTVLGHLVRA